VVTAVSLLCHARVTNGSSPLGPRRPDDISTASEFPRRLLRCYHWRRARVSAMSAAASGSTAAVTAARGGASPAALVIRTTQRTYTPCLSICHPPIYSRAGRLQPRADVIFTAAQAQHSRPAYRRGVVSPPLHPIRATGMLGIALLRTAPCSLWSPVRRVTVMTIAVMLGWWLGGDVPGHQPLMLSRGLSVEIYW
jgi:hypothetical protein